MAASIINYLHTGHIDTDHGLFPVDVFTAAGQEIIVVRNGPPEDWKDPVLCRIQSRCVGHLLGDVGCDCAIQTANFLRRLSTEPKGSSGLLILLPQEGTGAGFLGELLRSPVDMRDYRLAAMVLRFYGVKGVRLFTMNSDKVEALRNASIGVMSEPLWDSGRLLLLGAKVEHLIRNAKDGKTIPITPCSHKPRVLVCGDLNIDIKIQGHGSKASFSELVGGTGYHAARAARDGEVFEPILFGRIGRYEHGERVRSELAKSGIISLIGVHPTKKTGYVTVTSVSEPTAPFQYSWDKRDNANDYDVSLLNQAIALIGLGPRDYVFVSSYLFVQKLFDAKAANDFLMALAATGSRILLDMTSKTCGIDVLKDCGVKVQDFGDRRKFLEHFLKDALKGVSLYVVIGEERMFNTLGFNAMQPQNQKTSIRDIMRNNVAGL